MSYSFKKWRIEGKKLYTFEQFLLMIIGVGLSVFALKGFMIPNKFLDGGVTGISIFMHEKFHFSFSIVFIILNVLFLVPAYLYMGKYFAFRSLIVTFLLSIGVEWIHIHPVTSDKLLIAIFGGCILGVGVGLVARTGSALDGFEILAESTIKKIGFSITEVILFLNTILFLLAAIEFGIEPAMYSIITYFAALKTFEYVVDGIEEYISLTVVSGKSEEIKKILVGDFEKGITVYKAERGFLPGSSEISTPCDVLITIVTRFELLDIKDKISGIDPHAFVYTYKIKETKGGIVKRRNIHH